MKILWAAACFLGLQTGGVVLGEEPDALTKSILGDWIGTGGSGMITIQ